MKHRSRRPASGGAGMTAKVQARLGPLTRLVERRRHDEIVSTSRELLKTLPTHPYVLKALSFGLIGQQNYDLALPVLEQALRLNAGDPELHNNLGICLSAAMRSDEAIECFDRALALDAADPEVWRNMGEALCQMNRWADAIPFLVKAIELFPGDYDAAIDKLAQALMNSGRNEEALACYRSLSAGEPDNAVYLGAQLTASLKLCHWEDLAATTERLRQISAGFERVTLGPFHALAVPGIAAAELRRIIETYARREIPDVAVRVPALSSGRRGAAVTADRLRIGYLSHDWVQTHPVAQVVPQVFECHNRSRLEVFAYSMGPDDGSAVRRRLISACEHFVDVRTLGVESTAQRIHEDRIDILVDLQGWTTGGRPIALARRAAPIQVNWLGYAATMGLPRLADYIIGDSIVTPPEHATLYTEQIARLPHCYLPMDATQVVGERPDRAAVGLPPDALVFCSFNNSYKFNPQVFDLWCRLLNEVPGSCLWLSRPAGNGAANLMREALARGVAADRIIFAGRVEQRSEYLARLQLADLALDPFPYTSHSSGMDVLWAGVPMVTLLGDTFASRVGASLLAAAGLPECISRSTAEYLQLCIDLCCQPGRLQELRERLAANRNTAPLFDMKQFTRDLEDLYFRMHEGDVAPAEASAAKG